MFHLYCAALESWRGRTARNTERQGRWRARQMSSAGLAHVDREEKYGGVDSGGEGGDQSKGRKWRTRWRASKVNDP